jgi:hypothetical protein
MMANITAFSIFCCCFFVKLLPYQRQIANQKVSDKYFLRITVLPAGFCFVIFPIIQSLDPFGVKS